jgi:two-component system NtrC family sensor kinase
MFARFHAWGRDKSTPAPVVETPSPLATLENKTDLYPFLECLADPALLLDRQGYILAANTASTPILGYSVAEMLGKTLAHLQVDFDFETYQTLWDQAIEQKNITSLVMLRRQDGTEFPCKLRASIFYSDLRPLLFVSVQAVPTALPLLSDDSSDALVRILQDTNALLSSDLGVDAVLDHILASIQRLVSCDAVNVMLIESGIAHVVRCRGYAEQGNESALLQARLPLTEYRVLRRMSMTGDPVLVNDTESSDWQYFPGVQWVRSYLGIPILVNAQAIGFIALESAAPYRYSTQQISQLVPIANQVAIALKDARILAGNQRRVRELSALITVVSSINSTLELEWVFRLAMQEVQDLFEVERCSLILLDEQTDELVFHAGDEATVGLIKGMRFSQEESIVGWVVREGKPALVNNVRSDPRWRDIIDTRIGFQTRSLMAVPIRHGDEVTGVLEAINKAQGDFTKDDLRLLDSISMAVGQAVENARLFGELNKAYQETEQKQILITESRNTLRAVFDGITDRMCLVNQDFQVIALNLAAAFEVGIDLRRLIGVPCRQVICKSDQECDTCLLKKTFTTREPVSETNVRQNRLGIKRELEERTYPIENVEGVIDRVVYIAHDVTEKRRMEAALIQSAKLSAVGQLAAGVAHEINNPMSAIIGNAQMLLESVDPTDPRHQMAQLIERAGMRAGRVVRNLLDFSRQEDFVLEPTDLNTTIEDALSLVAHQLERNKIRVIKNLQPNLPLIGASASHLQTVWTNLLLNAQDALAQRPERRIEIFTTRSEDGKEIHAIFMDTGKGIPEKEQSRIFDPFFTTKPQGKGTGLGLAISYSIINEHHGTIQVQSKEGEGARFIIALPVTQDLIDV